MKIELLSLFVAISVVMAIIFRLKAKNTLFSIFKPLTTILIIIIAFIIFQSQGSTYSIIIISALIFSLVGDVFLVDDKYFLQGLIFFFFAQILFMLAFASIFGFSWNLIILGLFLIFGGAFYNFLRKDMKEYAIPALFYITVILLMNWQAVGLLLTSHEFVFIAIALASLFFTFSDSIIAYTQFKKPLKIGELLILSTYWIAIYTFTIAGLYLS